jgi:hypothetical protein
MREDLKKHLLAGVIIGAVGSLLLPGWAALACGIAIAWVKEFVWDRALGQGAYESIDAQWTIRGCGIAVVLIQGLRW